MNEYRNQEKQIMETAIAKAEERGGCVYVTDRYGAQICTIALNGRDAHLLKFDEKTVEVKTDYSIRIYDATGRQVGER